MSQDNFTDVISSYEEIKKTIRSLEVDYDQTVRDIQAGEEELKILPMATVPFDDMKEAILDFVDASGERHAKKVRAEISNFAIGHKSQCMEGNVKELGTPVRFFDLEGSLSGLEPVLQNAQILHEPGSRFSDHIFNYFCGALVRDGLRKILDQMSPEEFGYDKIHPAKIGTPRRERRAAIAALESRLVELRKHRDDIRNKLTALGVAPANFVPRK